MQDDEVTSDRVQGSVLEPCRVAVDMKMKGATGDFNLSLSDLKLNLAPDIVELVQSLQSSVLEPLVQPAPDRSVPQHRVCIPHTITASWSFVVCRLVVSSGLASAFSPGSALLSSAFISMFLVKTNFCTKCACGNAGQWPSAHASVRFGRTDLPMQMRRHPAVMPMCWVAREESPSGDLRLQ